jgi:ribosomal-protein-alanine N-acetyltransferase
MEKMPFSPELETSDAVVATDVPTVERDATSWQDRLPTMLGRMVTLRELRTSDAPALFAALSTEQVTRFISPPPSTVDGFEKFIAWTHRQRSAGQYVCFAVVPKGSDRAVGIFQIRALDLAFETAEWGFALASEFWGTGVFVDGAELALEFAFDTLGVHRLEARAALRNGRGNGALRKLGAVQECVLRRSFLRNGEYLDQALWTILEEDWRAEMEGDLAAWDDPAVLVH